MCIVLCALAGSVLVRVGLTSRDAAPEPPLASAALHAPFAAPQSVQPATTAAEPVRLLIPAIGVDSELLHLSLARDHTLNGPPPGPHYDQAGWYVGSPTPGSSGPAVIVGHVDSARSGPSVFFLLGSLRRGEIALVTRSDATVARFSIDLVARFAKSSFPTQLVYGNTSGPELRLITCGGSFDRGTGHYQDNIVVLAHLLTRNTAPHALVVTGTAS